jgi:hypothetical protein
MHVRIRVLSRGFKLSISKQTKKNTQPGCKVSALDFFVKEIPLMACWHQAHSDEYFSASYWLDQALFYCWKSESGFEIVTQLADTGKRPSSHR